MNLSDKIYTTNSRIEQNDRLDYESMPVNADEEGYPIISEMEFLAKCVILPNNESRQVRGKDGIVRDYSYVVFYRKVRGKEIPTEEDIIHLTKKDGTVDTDCVVVGMVTLRNWVKVWARIWV